MVKIKRVYDPPAREDGVRVLIDRIWPRGLAKADAAVEHWLKEAAPSTALRQWFGHDPARFAEFRRRYREELAGRPEVMAELRRLARKGTLTLVFAARDTEHSNAAVLRELLARH